MKVRSGGNLSVSEYSKRLFESVFIHGDISFKHTDIFFHSFGL